MGYHALSTTPTTVDIYSNNIIKEEKK